MQKLFLVKVVYEKIDDQSGKEKKVTEQYLLDAVSFTEAEARTHKEMESMIRGEFLIASITRANFSDIFDDVAGDTWWKAKIKHMTVDEKSGREKSVSNYILIMADNVDHAYKNINEAMKGMTVDFTIESISDSQILDFFPYVSK